MAHIWLTWRVKPGLLPASIANIAAQKTSQPQSWRRGLFPLSSPIALELFEEWLMMVMSGLTCRNNHKPQIGKKNTWMVLQLMIYHKYARNILRIHHICGSMDMNHNASRALEPTKRRTESPQPTNFCFFLVSMSIYEASLEKHPLEISIFWGFRRLNSQSSINKYVPTEFVCIQGQPRVLES